MNVQSPALLDKALSARRVDKQQIRAIFELQNQTAANELLRAETALKIKLSRAEAELMRTDIMLTDRTSKLLCSWGMLNVRGVLKWLKDEYELTCYFDSQSHQESDIWKAMLSSVVHKELVACLETATSEGQQVTDLHLAIQEIYTQASHGYVHPYASVPPVVAIIKGPLLPTQAQIMVCICKHFKFPYKLYDHQEKST